MSAAETGRSCRKGVIDNVGIADSGQDFMDGGLFKVGKRRQEHI